MSKTVKAPSFRPSGKLSLVIPCYNEQERVDMMAGGIKEFSQQTSLDFEVIVVDDGSTDQTVHTIESNEVFHALKESGKFKLIQNEKNSGKGAALKRGVEAASGTHILTLDADMSARPVEADKWIRKNGSLPENAIWIGSRENKDSKITEVPSRRRMGRIFNWMVRMLTPLTLHDTQCGFKLYPAAIGKNLFHELHNTGWAHDVEILYRAYQKNIPIKDLPLTWEAKSGSKISPLRDSLKMFFGVLMVSLRLKWEYFVSTPLKIISNKQFAASFSSEEKRNSIFRLCFFVAAILIFIVMVASSFQYGITGDEAAQKAYGEKVLDFFTSFGKDRSCLSTEYWTKLFKTKNNLYYYGGFFDMLCAAANRYVGVLDPYDMRHLINAIFGFIAILYAARVAQFLGSWRSGFICLILLATFPQFFGQSMNNPKDIPFAAAYIFTIYYLFQFISRLPRPDFKTCFLVFLGIALTINIRVGGLLLIGMLIAFIGAKWLFDKNIRQQMNREKGYYGWLLKTVLIISVAGYFGGLLFWPYGLIAPFSNPFTALKEMSNFATNIRILFDGNSIMSNQIPWYYIPKWIEITTPLVILFAAVLFVLLVPLAKKYFRAEYLLLLLFIIIFPWAYAVYKKSSLYDGVRHFLFVLPPITVAAAIFYEWLFLISKSKLSQYVIAFILAFGIFLPLSWSIRNHPNEYVYFNELQGGINGAYGNFETDYYMNSLRQSCEWLKKASSTSNQKVIVATNCVDPVNYYLGRDTAHYKIVYARFDDRGNKLWDYGIFYSRFIDGSRLKNNSWLGSHTIYEVKADEVPLSIVMERKDKSDYYASQFLQKNNYHAADSLYHLAVNYDPRNAEALAGLGQAQLQDGNMQGAISSLTSSLKLYPGNAQAMDMLGLAYAQTGQVEQGIQVLNDAIKANPSDVQAYYYLGMIYQQRGDRQTAQQYFNVVKQYQQQMQQQ